MKASTGSSRSSGVLAAGVLSVLLLVLGVTLTVVWATRVNSDGLTSSPLLTNNGDKLVSDDDQAQVKAVAEQFCLRMDNVDGSDPSGYASKIKQLLTTKEKAAFDQQFEAIQKLQTDKSVKGVGKILATGIADIDPDSATVLVAHDTSVTSTAGPVLRHGRWTVTLRKVGGHWLVDDWNPAS